MPAPFGVSWPSARHILARPNTGLSSVALPGCGCWLAQRVKHRRGLGQPPGLERGGRRERVKMAC